MSSTALVTICIPNFNKGRYLARTLRSVFAQTYHNIEILFIDDCSTDDSRIVGLNLLQESPFAFRLIENQVNKGVGYCARLGVIEAKGKYFQVLSSDDLILPEKIARQVEILENAPQNTGFLYSPVGLIDEDDQSIEKNYFREIGFAKDALPAGLIYADLLRINFIPALSTLLKTEAVRAVGNYDDTLLSEDWEIWLRLSKQFEVIFDHQVSALYRVERNSLMHGNANKAPVFSSFCKTLIKHAGQNRNYDRIIYSNIRRFAGIIYSYDGKESRYWLRKAVLKSFSFKNFLYLLASTVGIKYSIYKRKLST